MIRAQAFTHLVGVHAKDGFRAARAGKLLTENPWRGVRADLPPADVGGSVNSNNAQIAYDLEQLQRALTGRRVDGETRSSALLRKTAGDGVKHVETKGRRKGTRRERKAR